MHWKRDIEVLTPLFNRGAYQDTPELRVPSIRGMVRWWFRALGGTVDEEKEAFGGMKKFGQRLAGTVHASNLVFRITSAVTHRANPNPATLPHKVGGQASPQAALAPNARFRLEVFTRLGSLRPDLQTKVERALGIWILLGSLGLRANRGGGSLWPLAAPTTTAEFKECLIQMKFPWPVYLAGPEVGDSVIQLHKAATDTVPEPRWVFGSARGGRLSSPLKLKVIRLEGRLRLLITAPDEKTIGAARDALHRKPIPALSLPASWVKISP
ncbi:MAG: type III-B CRISPR module RAMP protein Cmr1 [Verrucomicrobia bacterium]|nr:type III-B CRISPR module RAMP protein Cmr1 [Verrucomicrobiota bacterium]